MRLKSGTLSKLLVANRGEIACRVIKTARRLGIETVAVHSTADARAPHVALADHAVCVGPPPSAQSYLNTDTILETIRRTNADAVHPGYGFLSENAAFADAVESMGVAWVGPGSHAIRAMGDKIESKRIAAEAGVSTIPGFEGVIASADEAAEVATRVGFPVMIKASAGGGGKGMRIARNADEARAAFGPAQREAAASFGDDRIFVERYLECPRHIEIQLLADSHGNGVYLPERECSIQRRNQKVVEEAPAPNLSRAAVDAMGKEALALAKAVGYRSAGTVEFLLDGRGQHYFLEMNTRLQVEHPVTEMVAGLDLVECMLRIAAGEKLGLSQAEASTPRGWAMESRVYAEDPLNNFLPSIGTLSRYAPPAEADVLRALGGATGSADPSIPGVVRVDDGVREGGEISMHYDPMIAKLITYGSDREHARQLMLGALDRYTIGGLTHNINFLRTLTAHPRFAAGDLNTSFIPEEFPDGYSGHQLEGGERLNVYSAVAALQFAANAQARSGGGRPIARSELCLRIDAARDADESAEPDVVLSVGSPSAEPVEAVRPGAILHVHGVAGGGVRELHIIKAGLGPDGIFEALVLAPATESAAAEASGGADRLVLQVEERRRLGWKVRAFGTLFDVAVRSPISQQLEGYMLPPPPPPFAGALRSPMPGTLQSVLVRVGDTVTAGQDVCVVEAMKMQNVLAAPRDAVVKELLVDAGATLSADEPIIVFEED